MKKYYRYTVRFNLAKGSRYLTWKIYDRWAMSSVYLDRDLISLLMIDCLLANQRNQAEKIFNGANKSVCAHISCNHIQFELPGLYNPNPQVSYNPRTAPNWIESNMNVDGKTYDRLTTNSNKVFVDLI